MLLLPPIIKLNHHFLRSPASMTDGIFFSVTHFCHGFFLLTERKTTDHSQSRSHRETQLRIYHVLHRLLLTFKPLGLSKTKVVWKVACRLSAGTFFRLFNNLALLAASS